MNRTLPPPVFGLAVAHMFSCSFEYRLIFSNRNADSVIFLYSEKLKQEFFTACWAKQNPAIKVCQHEQTILCRVIITAAFLALILTLEWWPALQNAIMILVKQIEVISRVFSTNPVNPHWASRREGVAFIVISSYFLLLWFLRQSEVQGLGKWLLPCFTPELGLRAMSHCLWNCGFSWSDWSYALTVLFISTFSSFLREKLNTHEDLKLTDLWTWKTISQGKIKYIHTYVTHSLPSQGKHSIYIRSHLGTIQSDKNTFSTHLVKLLHVCSMVMCLLFLTMLLTQSSFTLN